METPFCLSMDRAARARAPRICISFSVALSFSFVRGKSKPEAKSPTFLLSDSEPATGGTKLPVSIPLLLIYTYFYQISPCEIRLAVLWS